MSASDPVNHPAHYTSSPARCACGAAIECISITERMDFVGGNVVKYQWRAGLKDGESRLQALQKSLWYAHRAVQLEIANQERAASEAQCSGVSKASQTTAKPTWCGKPIAAGWWWLQFSDGPAPRYWDGVFWDRGSSFVGAEDYAEFPIIGPCVSPGNAP